MAVFPGRTDMSKRTEAVQISVFYLLTRRGVTTFVCANPILEDNVRGSRRLICTVTT
jgi:hypothetical protein